MAGVSHPAIARLSHATAAPTADRHHAADGDAAATTMTTLQDAVRPLWSIADRWLLDGGTHGHRVNAAINNRAVSKRSTRAVRHQTASRRRRRARFCRRQLTSGPAPRATAVPGGCGLHDHRGRPRGLQPWPGGGCRRAWRAFGGRATFLNIHVPMTHATSLQVLDP